MTWWDIQWTISFSSSLIQDFVTKNVQTSLLVNGGLLLSWSVLWESWKYRKGFLVPGAARTPPLKTIFSTLCYFEGFRHFLIVSKSSPHTYYLWTEQEVEREMDWAGMEGLEDTLDEKIDHFMNSCVSCYPMIKRHSFVKEHYHLLKDFEVAFEDHNQ